MAQSKAACGLATLAFFFGAEAPLWAQVPPASTQIDPASVPMPELAFTPGPDDAANYDKYFYFHRADTDFATAYADLRECDGYARGLASGVDYGANVYPVPNSSAGVMTGMVADMVGAVMSDVIYGSAERRRQRRAIMMTCMGFKGYRIIGLPKALWERFNFEEGNHRVPEDERQRLLRMQARAASGPQPGGAEVRP